MKQAKAYSRKFPDLSAWDILTGDAEKRKKRIEWEKIMQQWKDFSYSSSRAGKSMMSDYMLGIQSVGRGLRETNEVNIKILKNRNETNKA